MQAKSLQRRIPLTSVEKALYPEATFRTGTQCWPTPMNFALLNGGMGDYICWIPAIQWIAECATWIKPSLVCPVYFVELARVFMKRYPHVPIKTYRELNEIPNVDAIPCRGPINLATEALNATGAHLLTCGWVYFTNKDRAPSPEWDRYPPLTREDLDAVALPAEIAALKPGSYAVITTGLTTPSRFIKPEYWNLVIDYVVSLGLTPVFVGKAMIETGNASNVHTNFRETEIHYDKGIRLFDRTSLLQAARVMNEAAVTIGHDNGLLHLAACTPDASIVFGYNLASPAHREPRRVSGKTYNVTLTQADLACNHCQSHNNFVLGFSFRECFYKDLRCMDLLFDAGARRWREQIDLALTERNTSL